MIGSLEVVFGACNVSYVKERVSDLRIEPVAGSWTGCRIVLGPLLIKMQTALLGSKMTGFNSPPPARILPTLIFR